MTIKDINTVKDAMLVLVRAGVLSFQPVSVPGKGLPTSALEATIGFATNKTDPSDPRNGSHMLIYNPDVKQPSGFPVPLTREEVEIFLPWIADAGASTGA